MEPQIRYARTSDGVSIAYSVAGSGPLLLWAPDLPQCHRALEWQSSWRRYFEQLADEFTLVRFDARGVGLSDRDVSDFSFEARMRDLEAVVALVARRPFPLMGSEWSGPLTIAYAARHPESVSHLILHDTFARAAEYAEHPLTRISMELLDRDWELFVESRTSLARGVGDEGIQTREQVEFYKNCITPETDRLLRAQLAEDDATEWLAAVEAPTLILHHTGTRTRPVEMARRLAAGIRDSRVVTLEGGAMGSWPRMLSQIANFVKGSPPASPVTTEDAALNGPRMAPPASAVQTILFTDLVGHTEMMQRLGDVKGRDVLREHERITRATLGQHGGAEVKTMGDGFLASFASVTSAVECAIALQRAFAARNDGDVEPLHVRVGLNAGEPIEEDGDLFGSTVILASRIAAKAGADEILIPEPIRHLLAGKNYAYADCGEFVPKGFDDAVRLYEVRWREGA